MSEWLAHPLTVATYVALFSLAIGAIRAIIKLFDRVNKLEASIEQLRHDFLLLSNDLRLHMLEETRNVQHLEQSIQKVADLIAHPNEARLRD